MLKLYDQNHNAIGHIVKYKNCKIESELSTGDKTLSFTYLAKHHKIQNEYYIRTKDEEYVIKEVPSSSSGFPEIVAVLNLEDLQKDMWQTFSVKDATIDEAARTVLAGTGWTIGNCDVTKRRNAGMMQVSTLEVLQKLCAAFMCDPVFDTINKRVSFYEKRGQDKGVYFMSGLNLKKIKKSSKSYDFYTRIIPIGQDGLTIEKVNDGKNYLENYEYSKKVLTYIWKDESYTDAQALKEDAELKLKDLAKPEVSFSADVRDLAKQKPGYSILSYNLGDTVTLIDRESGIWEKQRIVKMVEYPKEPEKNTCELANTFLTFTQMQEKYQAAADIINFTVAGDGRYTGKINVSDILNFESGLSGSATMGGILGNIETMEGEIGKVKIRVGTIEANYLKVEEADLKYATIENLNATNGTITNLKGEYAEFKTVITEEISAQKGMIDTITGDLADYKKVVTEELVTAKGWMASGSIGDAQISSLSANKVTAGTIDAAIVTIAGTDGRLQISDNTIQIKDTDRVRVQMGKDASGDYSLSVWDSQGNLIWDALGATEKTIQRKIIRDSVVADDAAIQALKVDFRSFDTALTEQGVTISGTVIQVGSKTLSVVLSEQEQALSEQGKTITDHASKIEANEKNILLKVDTQVYQKDLTGMKEKLKTVESEIAVLDGKLMLKVEQVDIDTAIQSVEDQLKNYSTVEQMKTEINLSKDAILSSVAESYSTREELAAVDGKVSSLEIWQKEASQKITKDGIIATVGNYYAYKTDIEKAEERVTLAESKITQQSEQITLKVEKNGVISAINQTPETITINASKVNLTGYVTLTNLSAPGQTVINGGNITTGTVSADRIDVTGLFAKDITATGTIRGVNLVGANGSFSGNVTAASGQIGPWLITSTAIYKGNAAFGNAGGMYFGDAGLSIKNAFKVDAAGKLTATNSDITGSIKATDITARNTYYINNSAGVKKAALTAVDASFGQSLTVGSGFSTLYLNGLVAAAGSVHCGPDNSYSLHCGLLETWNSAYIHNAGLELYGGTPFIDFHFNNSSADYTARIIEWTSGTLTVHNNLTVASELKCGSCWMSGNTIGVVHLESIQEITLQNIQGTMVGVYNSDFRTPNSGDGKVNLGSGAARWKKVYSISGTIGTSDERDKNIIGALDYRHKELFMKLKPIAFTWKNDKNGVHYGLGAQATERSALSCGITKGEIAAIEHDFWEEPSMDGRTDRYGMAYDEIHILTIPVVQEHEYLLKAHAERLSTAERRIMQLESELALAYGKIALLEQKIA